MEKCSKTLCRTQGFINLSFVRMWCDSHKIGKQEPNLTWRWRSKTADSSQCAQQKAGPRCADREQTGVSDAAAPRISARWGEPGWIQTVQIKRKKRWGAWPHPWAISFLSSFLLASFLWQSAENRPRWQSHWRASQLSGHRKSWSLWAISLQFAASVRPHVIKLSLWESVKKEKTTCDLTCWFPETTTLQGAEGKGTEAGGGTEVCNKDPSFSFQEVFKPAAPWGHHWDPT